jgi:hypothetical protein
MSGYGSKADMGARSRIGRMKDYRTKRPDDWRTTARRHDQHLIGLLAGHLEIFGLLSARQNALILQAVKLGYEHLLAVHAFVEAGLAGLVLSSDSNGACR